MSPYNSFMSDLIKNCIAGTYPDFAIDYSTVRVAQGSLEGITGVSSTAVSANKIKFDWTDNTGQGNASEEDILCICCYNKTSGDVTQLQTTATRSSITYTTASAVGDTGDKVQVYAFFISPIDGSSCDSEFLGEKTLIS
jgi:hypothetical protein